MANIELRLREHLVAAGAIDVAAANTATLIVALMEGALVLARVYESSAPLALAGGQAASLARSAVAA